MNGEHKEKDLEPWDGGEGSAAEELEALETDVVSTLCLTLAGWAESGAEMSR